MGFLPIFLDATGRRCVVIGGGEVAERRAVALLAADARVTVISPTLTPELNQLCDSHSVEHISRDWRPGDLKGFEIAFAATDSPAVHQQIADEAQQLGVKLNIADEPKLCDFIVPSVVRQGDLQIAISTSGTSPALAARIRRNLESTFGSEYAAATQILGAARKYLKAHEADSTARAARLQALADSDLVELLRCGDSAGVEGLIFAHVGVGLRELNSAPVARDGQS